MSVYTTIEFKFPEHKERLEIEKAKDHYGSLGKYLFFCKDKATLFDFCSKICEEFGFSFMQINNESGSNDDYAYVCKIYHYCNNMKHTNIFSERVKNTNILFRHFKYEWKTQANIYSSQYLSKNVKQSSS